MGRSIRELKGIGEKTEKLFLRLGVEDLDGLLAYYPRTYDVFREPQPADTWKEKQVQAVYAPIDAAVSVKQTRNSVVTAASVRHGDSRISLIWFRMPYLRSTLKKGQQYVFRGQVARKGSGWEMEQPKIYTPRQYEQLLHSMQPVYGLTKGLTSQAVAKAVRQALEKLLPVQDDLPEAIRKQYQLMD